MDEDLPSAFDQMVVRADIGRKFCDVVLKGGITSGVVYPTAIARLARQYRFRNIGGTSAGAVAAAGAAAAEYRRATAADATQREAGFDLLAALPEDLARKVAGSPHSKLFHLFQPEPATRRHFAILGAALNRAGPGRRIARALAETMWQFRLAALAGSLPALYVALSVAAPNLRGFAALVVCAAFALGGSVAAAVVAATTSLLRALPAQDFGLSRGFDARPPGASPPLVNWLYPLLQRISGKALAEPLTFGDLDRVSVDGAPNGIGLSMMTTALSMGRPMTLPFRVGRFYFREDEMARYFPGEVVAAMIANPAPPRDAARDQAMRALGYHRLPEREALPVIVATRMSLSVPFLLSAIPLYRHAWEDERPAAAPTGEHDRTPRMRRVLFSDGGICSNFPLHLFDTVLPSWPTFGFNLRADLSRDAPASDRAYLPRPGRSLGPEHYAIAEQGAHGAVAAFAVAIVMTMQNWRDNLQRAAPGFRDRVVTVRHRPDEGGLNLDMAADALAAMAASGRLAAERLVEAFATPPSIHDDQLTRHRWVRLRSLLAVLQHALGEIHAGVTDLDNNPTFPELIDHAEAYVGRSYPMRKATRAEAQRLLDALSNLHDALQASGVGFDEHAPRPEVAMRIQPVI
jgi:predicted acylesterase/phospholipase RssA